MAAPSPYYRTQEEKDALIKLRDEFGERFSQAAPQNLTILIAGAEGRGKTHLLCTMAGSSYGPLYIADTEHRAQVVVDKFAGKPVYRATVTKYHDVVAFVKWMVKNVRPPAVIGLDSGSDIDKFAEDQYLIHEDREVVGKPINHPKMNRYVYRLLDELKFSGFTVVLTAKMKDEYIGENRSGKKLPRIFKDVPYRADLVLEFSQDGRLWITKSGWTLAQISEVPPEFGLPEIIDLAKILDVRPTVQPTQILNLKTGQSR